ncbi:MAG: hypothetical protein HC941_21320 [Microcoleus sp. SU_5_3]|nr:hypothetical protein [Microcoleus sp. SU_5_3]
MSIENGTIAQLDRTAEDAELAPERGEKFIISMLPNAILLKTDVPYRLIAKIIRIHPCFFSQIQVSS